ncbi:MAG: flagellar biosynthetic protein FliR [Myxococcota bacterium]
MSIAIPLDWLTGFGLALTRLIGAFLYAPVFGHAVVPARVRLMIALALAFWLSSGLSVDPGAPGFSLGFALLREATIGLAIGFAASLVFTGFALMGEYAAMQGGLGAAAVLDPSTGNNSVVLTSLVGVLAGLAFLAIEGHHDVLRGLVLSFEALPVGGAGPDVFGFVQLAQLGSVIFEVGVKLAAPFTAVMLVSNVAVGILGRAIPQLNLMSIQLPAQIGLTLLILGLAAGPFVDEIGAVLRTELPRAVTVLWETP